MNDEILLEAEGEPFGDGSHIYLDDEGATVFSLDDSEFSRPIYPHVSVTVPTIHNTTFRVLWGNLELQAYAEYFEVQYSSNGGAWTGWANVGAPTNYLDVSFGSGVSRVTFRVRSIVGGSEYAWTYSAEVRVVANNPPTAPSSITVPPMYHNVFFVLEWGAGTDPQGRAITYDWQEQRNGGAWDTIDGDVPGRRVSLVHTSSATSAAYRVRTRNSDWLYSDWRTSSTYPVPTPQPPTTPPSITVPSHADINTNFTVSWGASTNTAGGTITYWLERQQADGVWASVTFTQGTSVQTSISTAGYFYHRVRAENNAGLYSGWKNSTSTTVTQPNRPPTEPPSITVPTPVYFNTTFTVSWGASTDPDGHAITYYLERQRDNGGWVALVSGTTARTYDQTIATESGITAVTYRVRAKDSTGAYSGWTTSPIRTITNRPPTAPPTITVPDVAMINQPHQITWGASTDPDGHSVIYVLQRRLDNNAFGTLYAGTTRSYTDRITTTGPTTAQWRVRAEDSPGAYSAWTTSANVPMSPNKPPIISGYDRHLWTLGAPFSYDYTVTDPEGEDLTITEKINGTIQRTFEARSGASHTFVISDRIFGLMPNGTNKFSITATDKEGHTATRTLTFTKQPDRISAAYDKPKTAETRPTRINILPRGNFPAGAIYKAYATNNGHDTNPTWEECTQSVNSRVAHVFQNKYKRSSTWGVNFKLEIFRDQAITKDACTLNGVSIQWE